jgi:hypothetical protein
MQHTPVCQEVLHCRGGTSWGIVVPIKGTSAFLWKIVGSPTLLKSVLIIFPPPVHRIHFATAFHSGTLLV